MTLRIIEGVDQFDAAIARLETALRIWGGGESQTWRAAAPVRADTDGVSFARRDDLYLYLEKTPGAVRLGAALADGDRDLFSATLPRDDPASARVRCAIAEDDEDGRAHLLVSAEALKAQRIRDPFGRLAGVHMVRRARVGERDYVLLGPLDAPPIGDALLALAGLSPLFERHVESLASFEGEARDALYAATRAVTVRHRAAVSATQALAERLRAEGFAPDIAETGALQAAFAMSRGPDTIVVETCACAQLGVFSAAVGRLALSAPPGAGLQPVLLMPAAAAGRGESLAPFAAALTVLGVCVVTFDFDGQRAVLNASPHGAAALGDLAAALIRD
ncbi:MAG: hypothetical protein GC206_04125 [Alphaproteobacteria bacterium]|nr:hypothetical protein [Alphaproteobacteria bacterium]